MKRYKDCALACNDKQYAEDLLHIVEQMANEKNYKTSRQSTFSRSDTLIVYTHESTLPYSRIVVCPLSDGSSVSVVNIVPMHESGVSHIGCSVYNQLLNIFRDDVLKPISEQQGNRIIENEEDYTIEDVIPKSFPLMNTWLSNYPLSGHPRDTHHWYDFVLALHTNKEHLSLDDFRKYIEENYGWDEEDLSRFELRLESQLELLEYYDEHR